jgi:hypothetical protein
VDHERLIQIAARLLLEKHGERAQSIAAQRAQEWVERQDGAAALFWLSISDAVGQLQAATAPKGASLSLQELLSGPTARRMMAADNVDSEEVIRLMEQVKKRPAD